MFNRGSGATLNKFWKTGRTMVKGQEGPLQITTRIEVGSGGAQATLDELRRAARTGESIVKHHNDGQHDTDRIDVDVRIGSGDREWSKKDIAAIIKQTEEANVDHLTELRRNEEQRLYKETFEAELRAQIEGEVRAEITQKAKKDADLAMAEREPRTSSK